METDSSKSLTFETTACPLCGSDESVPQMKAGDILYGMPGEFQLVRCSPCRHIYLNPRPTLDCILQFYPANYAPHRLDDAGEENREGSLPGPSSPRTHRPWYLSPLVRGIPGLRRLYYSLMDHTTEYFPSIDTVPRRALELGCAHGGFLTKLRERGWEAQGIELSPQPAHRAARRGFEVHIGTLESAEFPDERFDAVFAWMVIEHLHDPKGTLVEIHRVLKPSGWFVFSVPNFACWEPKIFGRYWYSLQLPTHLQHYTPRTLHRLLEESGFVLVKLTHQQNVLNLVGSIGLWLRDRFPQWQIGPRFIASLEGQTPWQQLALAPLAKVLAWLRQGGRLTAVARVQKR